jgi:hypothetical protein
MAKKNGRTKSNGTVVVHRLFGESFYENLHALMDEQIAEMMKEPKFRRMIEEFNVRMFEVMAEIARKHISGHK